MKKKILIFDDEDDILDICIFLFEDIGLTVHTRSHARNVLEDIRECDPDLVIMDHLIPDLGGIHAINLIKGDPQLKKIPVILFTASNNIESLFRESNADEYIEKPSDISAMQNKVAKLLSKSL